MASAISEPLIIDVRSILKPERHLLILTAMEKLAVGESLVVPNDHNRIPLRGQVDQATLLMDQSRRVLIRGAAVLSGCQERALHDGADQ